MQNDRLVIAWPGGITGGPPGGFGCLEWQTGKFNVPQRSRPQPRPHVRLPHRADFEIADGVAAHAVGPVGDDAARRATAGDGNHQQYAQQSDRDDPDRKHHFDQRRAAAAPTWSGLSETGMRHDRMGVSEIRMGVSGSAPTWTGGRLGDTPPRGAARLFCQ
jgi:hypothetical protein